MIHRAHSTNLAEINRVLELIQKPVVESSQKAQAAQAPSKSRGGGGSFASTKTTGGSSAVSAPTTINVNASTPLLVGADTAIEILVDKDGNVLTDERGYALLGVKVSSTILTGAGDSAVEVLSGS